MTEGCNDRLCTVFESTFMSGELAKVSDSAISARPSVAGYAVGKKYLPAALNKYLDENCDWHNTALRCGSAVKRFRAHNEA